jgi:D-alanyl-D-alanine carboxypeptidase/D-alanyl-D-alanine-endopeptidase (penicillin-binding protein 4)
MKLPKTLAITLLSLVLATGISSSILMSFWNTKVSNSPLDADKQSFCFESNQDILGKNIDLPVNPASVTKLYTTLWSLEQLGKDHRFQTNFSVKDGNLYIHGGSDPYFVTENLLFALSKLQEEGYSKFNKVVFDENFFFNWNKAPKKLEKALYQILNKKLWKESTFTALKDSNEFFKRNNQSQRIIIDAFSVKKVQFKREIELIPDNIFTLHSSPLYMHLKQVNMYSNNFYTDSIFEYLGGEEKFNSYIHQKLNTSKDEIYFLTGSGLGTNYTTCRVTLNMLEQLRNEFISQSLESEDVIAVPGSDAGTMKKRFTSLNYNRKIVAKTGTLNHTSAFSGFIFSDEPMRFAVFNHTRPHADKTLVRNLQDSIVKKKIDLDNITTSIVYETPDYISVKASYFE